MDDYWFCGNRTINCNLRIQTRRPGAELRNNATEGAVNLHHRSETVALEFARQVLLHQEPFLGRQRLAGKHVAKQPRGVGFDHPTCQTGNTRLRLDSRMFATILHTRIKQG